MTLIDLFNKSFFIPKKKYIVRISNHALLNINNINLNTQ